LFKRKDDTKNRRKSLVKSIVNSGGVTIWLTGFRPLGVKKGEDKLEKGNKVTRIKRDIRLP
jgi:hypothetical protein